MVETSAARNRVNTAPTGVVTESWFFPLAAAYGAMSLPLFIFGWLGYLPLPPGLLTPAGHAHELLFGFALAVVTGFLINRVSPARLGLLLTLWLLARLTFLFDPGSGLTAVTNIGFAGLVAMTAAPRFMKAAKKWRNRLIGPMVLAICAAAASFQLFSAGDGGYRLYIVMAETVVLFALLMLFFGGRLIAPAAAGAIERGGGVLTARVQPRVEGAILLAMIAAALTAPIPALHATHGLLLILAGLLALVRLGRWQLWRCAHRPDLLCLGLGYAWLGAGLLLLGTARGFDVGLTPGIATHAITVGALGTLTTSIMLRNRLLRLRVPLERAGPGFVAMTLLITTAALARLVGGPLHGLMLAAAAWSLALLLLLAQLLWFRHPGQPG